MKKIVSTIVNGILCFITAPFLLWACSFKSLYINDIKNASSQQITDESKTLTEQDIQHLPLLVQQYIRNCGFIGKPPVNHFKATFEGRIRNKEQQIWMPFSCEQHNFLQLTHRLFFMDAKMKGLPVKGYHYFKNGKAVMDIRLLSLFNVQYAEGKEMDISETVTFFNDMCFMAPAMLIDPRIKWISSTENEVYCSFTNNGITITVTLIFNEKGDIINFISEDRYAYFQDGSMSILKWQTPVTEYKTINGYRLPSHAEMIYTYPDGDFCYGEFSLKNISFLN
ncbi:MAG: hypothetical protein H6Q25_983 [Bacteroidetes bacterium]|nr:hypothetical protein [Bacteroidota bacterium]